MKRRITRMSIHQYALMSGALMAVAILPVLIPFMLFSIWAPDLENPDMAGFNGWALLVLPVIYFIFTYISVAVMCIIYNLLAPLIGGFEFDLNDQ
ncbi:hypothetical protein [Thalassotalea mangrovi]|uniref:DUF3566 domain-containing protein n=1 Tax=Thalassotalea mangrovi TaxID=2572245 RepID=A0A4U1B3J5_9GAMM|nr:hypothetical protein [Thalassotalea mangrovi]TKB44538.1 hypothetical protein E8M12_11665 [Thalassotalea mangrovi]